MDADLAPQLRRRQIDATSVYDIERQGWDDESVLAYAAREGRVLVTHNIRDFVALDRLYLTEGRTHAGIVLTNKRNIGWLQEALLNLIQGYDPRRHGRPDPLSVSLYCLSFVRRGMSNLSGGRGFPAPFCLTNLSIDSP